MQKTHQDPECDIFGRACFYNAMKNLTQSPFDSCTQCIDECDYIQYNKEIVSMKVIKQFYGKISYLTTIGSGKFL